MKQLIKSYWKTLLFFATVGAAGGYFTGLYLLDSYPAELRSQLIMELNALGVTQLPADVLLGLITALQSVGYGVILGALGIFFAKKVGLWRDERTLTGTALIPTVIVSVVGGLFLILPDLLFFGRYSEAIMDSYASKPTAVYVLASVTYGAVIEEVMLRLFLMSFVAFVLFKLFGRGQVRPATWMLVVSNVICAFLFAVGHLPTNVLLLGNSPLILIRCILLNGLFGLLFGWLYRKFGLRYAMLAHGGCHIVSKLIWILFV